MTSVVVCGCAGTLPLAGVALHYLQYCLGFRDLGVEVSYLEETGTWPYHPYENRPDEEASYTAPWLADLFESLDVAWAFRDPLGRYHGANEREVHARCAAADLLLNVSGSHHLLAHHRSAKAVAYVDTDPGFLQVKAAEGRDVRASLDCHDLLFTFAEGIGTPSCRLPDAGYRWLTTRQPVHLPFWAEVTSPPGATYTTVMNWRAYEPVEWQGETWGQKDAEFPIILDLPRRSELPLALAVGGPGVPREQLTAVGWRLDDPLDVTRTVWRFRDYIAASRGEITVAKQGYVRSRSGWFSERSANYLAAGRPVVAQDTGWSDHLPSDMGLLAFSTAEQAAEALEAVEAGPRKHAAAAREVAAKYFDASVVLTRLLSDAGVG